jgi:hypothetical protein
MELQHFAVIFKVRQFPRDPGALLHRAVLSSSGSKAAVQPVVRARSRSQASSLHPTRVRARARPHGLNFRIELLAVSTVFCLASAAPATVPTERLIDLLPTCIIDGRTMEFVNRVFLMISA